VNILHFLPHHFVAVDLLGMAAFLPELILTVGFETSLPESKMIEQRRNLSFQE
jgi:hypothetical protein